jgi:LAS superfamily LD-carboxypeptidase LdcB
VVVGVDSVVAVQQRIAAIQAQMQTLAKGSPNAKTPPTAATFAQVLGSVSSAQASSATTASSVASTAVDAVTSAQASSASTKTKGMAPAELARYGNGKIPGSALAEIGVGSHKMWAPAALSFQGMKAAAARDGVKIGVTDSYRSYDAQVDLAKRKGLYSQGGLAATPGHSNHGWGRSLDLDLDAKAQQWMRANGARYGFVEDVPREPWHWTFKPRS